MAINIKRDYTAKHMSNGARTPVGIVLHDTAGSGTINDVKYLANPGDGRQVSVDFVVTRDGGIYQLNPDLKNHWTYHAGRATKFKGFTNGSVNKATVGIEISQKANLSLKPLYPGAQVQAVAELCAYLCKMFNLKKEDITTHANIITDGSRSDPRQFPFADFYNLFNAAGGQKPTTYTVVAGDTLYALAKKYGTTIEEIKKLNMMNTASNAITVGQKLVVKA
ncbi:MAG: N-acetylmuramoyl-L-alanine amidase [Chloracidobacterium sp.]|nr:N-acetylmuramoyl-L-alanine amidase [Chloracidobacterium sp.]